MRALAIKLDDTTQGRLKRLGEARQRSTHWMMRQAVNEYLEREEKREALRREALESWQEYQQTGLHVTIEEVRQWVDSLGADNELEPPQCHP